LVRVRCVFLSPGQFAPGSSKLTQLRGPAAISPSWVVAGAQFEVQIRSDNNTWVYRPSFANCSGMFPCSARHTMFHDSDSPIALCATAPITCGDGFCQEPTETAASCPQDCQSCGPYPAALEGKPAKCVNGTWLVSGDLLIGEGEVPHHSICPLLTISACSSQRLSRLSMPGARRWYCWVTSRWAPHLRFASPPQGEAPSAPFKPLVPHPPACVRS